MECTWVREDRRSFLFSKHTEEKTWKVKRFPVADRELDADRAGLDELLYFGLSAKMKLFVLSHALLQAFGQWSLGGRVENCLGGLHSRVCVLQP